MIVSPPWRFRRGALLPGFILALSLLAAGAYGAANKVQVSLSFSPHAGAEIAPRPARLTLTPTVTMGRESLSAETRGVMVPGELDLELPSGSVWQAEIDGAGIWCAGGPVVAQGSSLDLDFTVYPLGMLTGTLTAPTGIAIPKGLDAHFAAAPGGDPEITGDQTCTIDGKNWQCALPAAELDVELEAHIEDGAFVPRYLWNVAVDAKKPASGGKWTLVKGSSIAGWVRLPDKSAASGATLSLLPHLNGAPLTSEIVEKIKHPLTAVANRRGFFQLVGMEPGFYDLRATKKESGFAQVGDLEVQRDRETKLAKPLVLETPAALLVTVAPPTDPDGHPWHLDLLRKQGAHSYGVGTKATTDKQGRHRFADLAADDYMLYVTDASNNTFALERFRIPDKRRLDISLHFVSIVGTVTIGGEPLAAELTFDGGGMHMRSDEDGHFAGVLPHAGKWRIQIDAEAEHVVAEKTNVMIDRRPDGRPTEVDIDLPDTELEGRTVDKDGNPVAQARILALSVASRSVFLQTLSDSQGAFDLRGLDPGTVQVSANGADRNGRAIQAPPQTVQVSENGTVPSPVVLVLTAWGTVHGRVLDANGQPLPDVHLEGYALGGGRVLDEGSVDTASGPNGVFSLQVPADTDTLILTLEPVGNGAMRAYTIGDPLKGPINLTEEASGGGSVELDIPDWFKSAGYGFPVLLFQNGTPLPVDLWGWARAHGAPPGDHIPSRLVVPAMAPGIYSACFLTPAERAELATAPLSFRPGPNCPTDTLQPGGTIRFDFSQVKEPKE